VKKDTIYLFLKIIIIIIIWAARKATVIAVAGGLLDLPKR